MTYRPDIDGLRALAIVPVVLYHAGLPPFSGGFAGVDIFFVISGYLISSIIMESVSQGTFRVLAFYERRARRLLPALFFAIALTMLGGLFTLTAADYSEMLQSALATTFFASNIFFLLEIDYFSQAAEFMPLLHTWSLAVEEQFYLFWPYLLLGYGSAGARKRLAWGLVGALVMCSFGASLLAMGSAAESSSFYLIFFRLWELGAGAIVAILRRERPAIRGVAPNTAFGLGALSVIATLVLLDGERAHGGLYLLPLVAGTCLMIISGDAPGNLLARPFRAASVVFVGKLSYSFYLLHWPVLAFYRSYQNDTEIGALEGALLLGASLVLAVVSYNFVESPVRRRASKSFVLSFSATGAFALSTLCFAGIALDGLPQRLAGGLPEYASSRRVMQGWPCRKSRIGGLEGSHCVFGARWEEAAHRVLLWGDSHAAHFAPLLDHAIDRQATSVLLLRPCPPFLDNEIVRHTGPWGFSNRCGEKHASVMQWLLEDARVDAIVMAAAWSGYSRALIARDQRTPDVADGPRLIAHGLDATLARLPSEIQVHILTDVPRPRRLLTHCVMGQGGIVLRKPPEGCSGLDRDEVDAYQAATTAVVERVASAYRHVFAYDSVDSFCSESTCDTFLEGRLLYRDKNHLRRNLTERELTILVDRLRIREVVAAIEAGADP